MRGENIDILPLPTVMFRHSSESKFDEGRKYGVKLRRRNGEIPTS